VRIGIDFDNTIINYHNVFHSLACEHGYLTEFVAKNKENVKQAILEKYGNDMPWQKLQSIAYGKAIFQAKAFEGALSVFQELKAQGHQLFIVSHKSETSHYDPTVQLRSFALQWLKSNNFVDEKLIDNSSLYFLETLDKKITTISELNLDIFIDDLDKVILHKHFPKTTIGIGFGESRDSTIERCFHWQQCLQRCRTIAYLGKSETLSWLTFEDKLPKSACALTRDGNNQIIEVVSGENKKYVLKKYYRSEHDQRNRGKTEFEALRLFSQQQIKNVPHPYYFSDEKQYAFYQFLESQNSISVGDSDESAKAIHQFVTQLKNIHQTADTKLIAQASDARNTLDDYFIKIESRLKLIEQGCALNSDLVDISRFIDNEFKIFKEIVFKKVRHDIAEHSLSTSDVFSEKSKTLSPSDLGPHNMLKQGKYEYSFIDFEYFGVDDACKMIADLFHHAQRKLDDAAKWTIYENYLSFIDGDQEFIQRFDLIIDLIGIEWVLIVLNIAAPDTIARRLFANPNLEIKRLINDRLILARKILSNYLDIAEKQGKYLTINENLGGF